MKSASRNIKDTYLATTKDFTINKRYDLMRFEGDWLYVYDNEFRPRLIDYLFFEHKEYGDECGGSLWFEKGELVDYDGVSMLPKEIAMKLKELDFDISYVEGDYD